MVLLWKSILYIETDEIYKDIAEDFETIFDTPNYEWDRPLPKGKNKKSTGLMKDELGGKIMIKFVRLGANTYMELMDDSSEDKNPKHTKTCIIKVNISFENYKKYLEANLLENKIHYLQKKMNLKWIVFATKKN